MQIVMYTHTHTHTHNCYIAAHDYPGEPVPEETFTIHTCPAYQPCFSASSINRDPWHPACSIYMLVSLHSQSLSKSSLVSLLVWSPPLHTTYIFSSSHYYYCLLFATHAHTIVTCFAVLPRLCYLFPVSLNSTWNSCIIFYLYHLTILISLCWSATSFSFLTGQVMYIFNHSNNNNTLQTTAVQPLSPDQYYNILFGKQWYQLPEFIQSDSNPCVYSCISISIYTQRVT